MYFLRNGSTRLLWANSCMRRLLTRGPLVGAGAPPGTGSGLVVTSCCSACDELLSASTRLFWLLGTGASTSSVEVSGGVLGTTARVVGGVVGDVDGVVGVVGALPMRRSPSACSRFSAARSFIEPLIFDMSSLRQATSDSFLALSGW